ncbi:hypothetical protein CCACVL1_09379 [Corchorus capsularis]|uniref:Uncharacterized protein n=1 Tax=Corchorus capsularis TaxID=210143 RepID=A0A1R3IWM2_COCAP|nr:hypothetical protein CCACVL1_09379 [Corchorus capsularis]
MVDEAATRGEKEEASLSFRPDFFFSKQRRYCLGPYLAAIAKLHPH